MIQFNQIVFIVFLIFTLIIYFLRNTIQNASSKCSSVQTQVVQRCSPSETWKLTRHQNVLGGKWTVYIVKNQSSWIRNRFETHLYCPSFLRRTRWSWTPCYLDLKSSVPLETLFQTFAIIRLSLVTAKVFGSPGNLRIWGSITKL